MAITSFRIGDGCNGGKRTEYGVLSRAGDELTFKGELLGDGPLRRLLAAVTPAGFHGVVKVIVGVVILADDQAAVG